MSTETSSVPGAALSSEIAIDFLYSEDCPSHERALDLLKQVVRDEDVRARIRIHRIKTDDEAAELRFPGSPTIRVNGADIDPVPPDAFGLACRAYGHENGGVSALPPRDRIVAALRDRSTKV